MKILSLTWLAAGAALIIWFAIELWQVGYDVYFGVHSGAFKAILIAMGFSSLCIIGALGLMLKRAWGRIIIIIVAIISVFYLLTGGLHDGGVVYAIMVIALSLLSIVSIVMLLKEWDLYISK